MHVSFDSAIELYLLEISDWAESYNNDVFACLGVWPHIFNIISQSHTS